ncbi:MAG: hypothetical protein AAF449_13990 [Myxococcota bacterium]
MDAAHRWLMPKAHARRLVHDYLDDESLSSTEAAWLRRRLAKEHELMAYFQQQQRLREVLAKDKLTAPVGFTERVVAAAQATSSDLRSTEQHPGQIDIKWKWAFATVIAASVVIAVLSPPSNSKNVALSGTAATAEATADFSVHVSGIGAVKARAHIERIVEAHGGEVYAESGGDVRARLPRFELVPVMQSLSKQGVFTVMPTKREPLAEQAQSIWVLFRFD